MTTQLVSVASYESQVKQFKPEHGLAAANSNDLFLYDWFTHFSLAPLTDSRQALDGLARAFRISSDEEREPITERLLESLRPLHLLLVLDNIEHLTAMGPYLSRILDVAPRLKILTTSREPVQITGEWTLMVAPLGLPDESDLSDLHALADVPAVSLFVRSAQEVNPDFALTRDNAHDVAEIAGRLDGLPLGIELAAARTNVLPPKLLLSRLSRRLPFAESGSPRSPRTTTNAAQSDWVELRSAGALRTSLLSSACDIQRKLRRRRRRGRLGR
jgi:non-specific serine/threonine protein kinase